MKKLLVLFMGITLFFGCNKDEDENTFVNGNYSAEEAEFTYGWKAYMNIQITDDKLISVDFDYLNENDNSLLKSETTSATYNMNPHPSVWLPTLEGQLMGANIDPFADVDGITGATSSSTIANTMMSTLLEAAKKGDTSKQIISAE